MNKWITTGVLPALALATAVLLTDVSALLAQGTGSVPTMRPYWHVFIAYAAVWLIILGWVISISRRLARLERSVGE